MARILACTLLAVLPAACATAPPRPASPPPTPPGVFPILHAVPPVPHENLAKGVLREDLEVRTTNWSPTPAVITDGTSPEIVLGPKTRLSFAGDAQGNTGWKVDNFLLVEAVGRDGKVLARFVIGFTEPVYRGAEMLDAVGQNSFHFGPRSPRFDMKLPRGVPLKLHVSALDYGAEGSVSDLYLVVEETENESIFDLRDDAEEAGFGL